MPRAYRLRLDFWGSVCDYLLPTSEDADHFASYFAEHHSDSNRPLHRFLFEAEGAGFVTSLMDSGTEKRIWHSAGAADWSLWDRFKERSQAPSPLPPLSLAPLRESVWAVHGAAVTKPNGGAVLLVGPSFSGKSALSIALALRGAGLLSDDLAVVDRKSRLVHPFRRPVGIRRNTFDLIPGLAQKVQDAGELVRIRSATTDTFMAGAAFLGRSAQAGSTPLSAILVLEQDPRASGPRLEALSVEAVAELIAVHAFSEETPAWVLALPAARLRYGMDRHFAEAVELIRREIMLD